MFTESGIYPSFDDHCQHQIVYGKVNVSIPYPPPYNRTIWHYAKSNDQEIKVAISSADWSSQSDGLDANQMAEKFTSQVYSILSAYIPNNVDKGNDNDPPWMIHKLKTAIKRKQRVVW